jgi:hypothetical protein
VKDYVAGINLNYVNAATDSPAQPLPRFQALGEVVDISFWEEDYAGFVLLFLSEAPIKNAADCAALRDWKLKSNLARIDSGSGWPRLQQGVYRMGVLKDPVTGILAKDWADLARLNGLPPDDGTGSLTDASLHISYISEQVGNLGYSALLGDQKARAGFDWLMAKLGPLAAQIDWRDSIGP